MRLIQIHYQDLQNGADLTTQIEDAFGKNGLGALSVTGVPNFSSLRNNLLPLAHRFANLPENVKNSMVHVPSFYSVGWSHGKEMMSKGIPDFSKGSYYNNPLYDQPFDDPELFSKYPAFCQPNIWPKEELPELEKAFKSLGKLIIQVGSLLAIQCDKFVNKTFLGHGNLHNIITTSRTPKARLLHYFPHSFLKEEHKSNTNWCGWHNDHGSLTGLVPAMYLNEAGEPVPNPDPEAGLYIRSRNFQSVKISVPADELIFQIGEASQIISGGLLQATPHYVKNIRENLDNVKGISRETFAVFMEPEWDFLMKPPECVTDEEIFKGSSYPYLPESVPLLSYRWNQSMNFGEFANKTIASYYQI